MNLSRLHQVANLTHMHVRDRKSKDVSGRIKRVETRIGNLVLLPSPQKNIRPVGSIESISDMHIWTMDNWKKNLLGNTHRRTGIRFRYDNTVDAEVKRACMQFAFWLRSEYVFPLRVLIYVKGAETIRTKDGENVVGCFFEPFSYSEEPYIRIATGDYKKLTSNFGKDNALATILASLAHELTHYYQWINNIQLTPIGRERQATRYAAYIIDEYSSTCEHP